MINVVIKYPKDIIQTFGYDSNKSINRDLEQYIFNSVKNYSIDKKLMLVLHVPKNISDEEIVLLQETIHNSFLYKLKETELYLKQQLKEWTINMIIGILFLVLCLILVQVLEAFSYINFIKIIKESLLIIGWVALWEPVTFILFGWRSMNKDRLYYKKLCSIPINVLKY